MRSRKKSKGRATPTQELVDILVAHVQAAAEAKTLEAAREKAGHALAVAHHLREHVGRVDTFLAASDKPEASRLTKKLDELDAVIARTSARIERLEQDQEEDK